jgi:hypothetical protein
MMYKTCVVFIDYDRLKMTTPRDLHITNLSKIQTQAMKKPTQAPPP